MEAYQRRIREEHAVFYAEAIEPLPELVRRRCVASIGTMETLSDEVMAERIGMEDAVDDLTALIVTWTISDR